MAAGHSVQETGETDMKLQAPCGHQRTSADITGVTEITTLIKFKVK